MNHTTPLQPTHELLARRLAASLDAPLAHDISERLRAARVRAVAVRRMAPMAQVQANGSLALALAAGHDGLRPWGWLASVLPLVALVVGLVTIKQFQDERRALELADIDTALLTDDLPPSAYTDPGFLRFLKMPLPSVKDNTAGAPNE
ncbi:MAG: DUF3619 family protein [Alphaproteobacteria bacterium]|nr:DUF3619 family protein [Alphaproteobacteria bacterium]